MVFKKETRAFVDNEALLRDLPGREAVGREVRAGAAKAADQASDAQEDVDILFSPWRPGRDPELAPAVVLANTLRQAPGRFRCKL